MMMNLNKNRCYAFLLLCLLLSSCRKTFLEAKPDNALIVPETIADFQAMMDYDPYINGSSKLGVGVSPGLLQAGGDDYFILSDAAYNGFNDFNRGVYIWKRDNPYADQNDLLDWSAPYRAILYCNLVLDGLESITPAESERAAWQNVKGSALFVRAFYFYQLAQAFAPHYLPATAAGLPGIALPLKPLTQEPTVRASLEQTYQQLIADARESISLLPKLAIVATRPSKAAAYGLLARINLTMGNYAAAGLYADSCLELNDQLLDYNQISTTSNNSFSTLNKEVIFHAVTQYNPSFLLSPTNTRVDTMLYESYSAEDLRKKLFFRLREPNRYSFKGNYESIGYPFCGLATDEMLLIQAECRARQSKLQPALDALNRLLITRWETGKFTPFTAATTMEALTIILTERRKELVNRGTRWADLRRLNQEPAFAKTIKRFVNGVLYELTPGDLRFTWPLPNGVIAFNPEIEQNPR